MSYVFETLIRAKKDDHSNYTWLYGRLVLSENGPLIQEGNHLSFSSIIKNTICYYTNHNDKNGNKIFTNDFYRDEEQQPVIACFIKEASCFAFLNLGEYIQYQDCGFDSLDDQGVPFNIDSFDCERISICGNIIDKSIEKLLEE